MLKVEKLDGYPPLSALVSVVLDNDYDDVGVSRRDTRKDDERAESSFSVSLPLPFPQTSGDYPGLKLPHKSH